MSDFFNPYAPPAAEIVVQPGDPLRTGVIMSRAWRIFHERFMQIAVTVMLIWVPCELLSCYMDAFVFGEDDLRKSFKFAQLLENFFGIIATAGVIHVALHHGSGTPVSIGQAFIAGLKAWPRMWWTRFLTGLLLILSFLLLVVPFFYLYPRLVLVDSVVICERLSGNAAMSRCQQLTQGRYWQVAGLLLILMLIVGVPIVLIAVLSVLEIIPDFWIVDAAFSVVIDITAAYGTVCFFCMYEAFSQKHEQPAGNDARKLVGAGLGGEPASAP